MKKKLALLLAAVMVAGMVPATAFAGVSNRITKTVSVTEEEFVTDSSLVIEEKDGDFQKEGSREVDNEPVMVQKTNASGDPLYEGPDGAETTDAQTDGKDNKKIMVQKKDGEGKLLYKNADGDEVTDATRIETYTNNFKFTLSLSGAKWSNKTFDKSNQDETAIQEYEGDLKDAINEATTAADGKATVTKVERVTSSMVAISFTVSDNKPKLVIPLWAQVTGSEEATVTIDRMESPLKNETLTFATVVSGSTTTTVESSVTIDTSAKSIKPIIIKENVAGTVKAGTIKLKLAGEFLFKNAASDVDVAFISGKGTVGTIKVDEDVIEIPVSNISGKVQIVISGIKVEATDDCTPGTVAEITVSGANTNSTTLEVGTYTEYGVTVSVEDKELPVVYAGTDNTTKTLKVTMKEDIASSWLRNRKTTFTFNEGVKIKEVIVDKNTGASEVAAGKFTINKNQASISAIGGDAKATVVLRFVVNVDPAYAGDITLTVGGAALSEDTEVKVATAKPLITVESEVNEAIIDYRQTPIADLVIKENKAGALSKNKVLYLEAEGMKFEDGSEYDIVEGDIKLTSVKLNGDTIAIKVKSESVKTPSVIKLSNLSLYMQRNLPAGDYRLYTVVKGTDAVGFETYKESPANTEAKFDTEKVTLMEDFVKVVTAGRDQDDSTFTTTVSVQIGATTMTAGTKTIDLVAPTGSPAYIKDGYTMLPVRAVATALSGSAQITWDDATKTVIIFFGSRIIKMTIGSKDMVINGTPTPMSAPAEITNGFTFIPMRDLGYGLGLNDDKINWDDATKTATLN